MIQIFKKKKIKKHPSFHHQKITITNILLSICSDSFWPLYMIHIVPIKRWNHNAYYFYVTYFFSLKHIENRLCHLNI